MQQCHNERPLRNLHAHNSWACVCLESFANFFLCLENFSNFYQLASLFLRYNKKCSFLNVMYMVKSSSTLVLVHHDARYTFLLHGDVPGGAFTIYTGLHPHYGEVSHIKWARWGNVLYGSYIHLSSNCMKPKLFKLEEGMAADNWKTCNLQCKDGQTLIL